MDTGRCGALAPFHDSTFDTGDCIGADHADGSSLQIKGQCATVPDNVFSLCPGCASREFVIDSQQVRRTNQPEFRIQEDAGVITANRLRV